MKEKDRLSVPAAGRTVSAAVEERAVHIRRGVDILEPSLRSEEAKSDFLAVYAPRWMSPKVTPLAESVSLRAAWTLVNVWILARSANAVGAEATLADAERWFYGDRVDLPSLAIHVPLRSAESAILSLCQISFDGDLHELLPYVLEIHGPGSRSSVMRDPTTEKARKAKRETGVFYTPADVAEYMAAGVLQGRNNPHTLRFLDPCCGTGVFFVAILRAVARGGDTVTHLDSYDFVTRCLYGFDISTLAIESATFVLLHYCMSGVERRRLAPWAAWHTFRLNLTATDSLNVGIPLRSPPLSGALSCRNAIQECLRAPATKSLQPLAYAQRTGPRDTDCFPISRVQSSIGDFFPEARDGFEVVICNPPYADLPATKSENRLQTEYRSLQNGSLGKCNLYPFFIEMMWRLTVPGKSTASVVVPLSISYHGGGQYKACRREMGRNGGRWQCAFFDREPHALFGEDVKTRNAILFRHELANDPPRGERASFETGPIRKWTSRTREKLFSSITFTPLKHVNVSGGLPKINGPEEAGAFALLARRADRLKTLCVRCRTCQPEEATAPTIRPRIFVASTAYNFLNVFRGLSVDPNSRYPLSENTVHCLEFEHEEGAQLAFAILSSRLTYWLWHVEGDAFHVSATFIQNLPFGQLSFSAEQRQALCQTAQTLWQSLQDYRIVSVNRGKQTIAFRPLACESERDLIDSILIDSSGLPKEFANALRALVRRSVIVDETDDRRNRLKTAFEVMENAL